MNKSQKRVRLEGRLGRLGRLLAEKLHVGKWLNKKRRERIDDIGVGLAADEIKRAADSIRQAAEAATRKARALQAGKKLRRR
jgi:hypothetical protein